MIRGDRARTSQRRIVAFAIGLLALVFQMTPLSASASPIWIKNLYDSRAFLFQDPYSSACTAAASMIMLNTIAYHHSGGPNFLWTPYRVKNNATNRYDYRDMTSILYFERAHDTLSPLGSGTDSHGWRNALNHYGWGNQAMIDPASMVYDDLEFTTFDAAVHAAVVAIARYDMPVGIVSWAGRHAQVMTGYVVDGEDPTVSDAFTVRYVYLSDPLRSDNYVNLRLTYTSFKSGSLHLRFQTYRETDSPYDDGYMPGWRRSSVTPTLGPSEWYRQFVILAPTRAMPSGQPDPSASPPPASPSPSPVDPTPTPSATAAPTSPPSAAPTSTPPASPAPSASPDPSPSPS